MDNEKFLKEATVKAPGAIVRQGTGITMNISIDAGSSETRAHVWAGSPNNGSVTGISSAYSVINGDIDSVDLNSNSVYDNLEMYLDDNTDNKKNKVFDSIGIVKGGLMETLRLPIAKTYSGPGKSKQDATYINAIANIAIRTYMNAINTGSAYDIYEVALTLALPREDVSSTKNQDEIKNKLAGEYSVYFARLDFHSIIRIRKENILLFDEAQATLGFWAFNNRENAKKYPNVLVVDAGGRSTDLSLRLNGKIVQSGSYTCKRGGQKFIDLIIESYNNDTGNGEPNREMVLAALDTGKLQDGNASIDITKYIDLSKKDLTKSIMNDIAALMDKTEVSMNQLNLVLCSGRLMGETHSDKIIVRSLSEYLEKEVKKQSPNTAVGRVMEEFALVRGLSLARAAYDQAKASKGKRVK